MSGDRFNVGKPRIGLISPHATKELAKVLTFGAQKYDPHNWMKGLPWMEVLDSMERHINAIKSGEDIDQESGCLHSAHVMCNAMFLSEFYDIYPQGDDRPHKYLKTPRIGLDIDDVLADWMGSFSEINKIERPTSWMFDRYLGQMFEEMKDRGYDIDDWMANLPILTPPDEIPFEPVVYITSREHCPIECAYAWLDKNKYPAVPVVQTKDKVAACKEHKVDIFVDDKFQNFVDINRAGILCYLFDAPHNRRYNVGHKRIYNLKQLQ